MTGALIVTSPAWRSMTVVSSAALPREVGGLLLGHYTEHGPQVTDALVVPDPRATRIRYRRDAATAARLLDDRIAADSTDLLGYLGEWHSHVLAIGPSRTDEGSILRLAADGHHDVVLLVVARTMHGWTGHARNATSAGTLQRIPLHLEGDS